MLSKKGMQAKREVGEMCWRAGKGDDVQCKEHVSVEDVPSWSRVIHHRNTAPTILSAPRCMRSGVYPTHVSRRRSKGLE